MGDMVAGMEDIAMGDMVNATLLQLEFLKIKMITTHPRMAMATVVAKMGVVLAVVTMVARIFIRAANDLLVGLSAAPSCKQDYSLVQTRSGIPHDTSPGHVARNEINLHADTCCADANWYVVDFTGE
eukprot:8801186-Ditylum_brightwellii.AAC.2